MKFKIFGILFLILMVLGCEKTEHEQKLKDSWVLTEWFYIDTQENYYKTVEINTNPCPETSYSCVQYKLTFMDSNKYQIVYDFGNNSTTVNGKYQNSNKSVIFLCSGHHPCMIWSAYSNNYKYLIAETYFWGDTTRQKQIFIKD